MAWCLAFKISQRGVRRNVEVVSYERRGAGQRFFENRRGLLGAQFDGGDALAEPSACRLRTQLTDPNGAISKWSPSNSINATGVVRIFPLVRPRTVSRVMVPNFTPMRSRNAARALLMRTK